MTRYKRVNCEGDFDISHNHLADGQSMQEFKSDKNESQIGSAVIDTVTGHVMAYCPGWVWGATHVVKAELICDALNHADDVLYDTFEKRMKDKGLTVSPRG